jgi:N-acetyl sugar amidotransferase
MDTTASDITFDDQGICNYCTNFLLHSGSVLAPSNSQTKDTLTSLVSDIKKHGRNKAYDCIVGVSGGVDSSWVLLQAKEMGLRPLAVHMDNGWNTELAQNNIANIVKDLNVDLYTHVINWTEYRALMQSFFDANVIDIELLYDNAMLAVNYQLAAKTGVKYILSGNNQATEGMEIPPNWNWFKYDKRNIKAIAKKFGGVSLKTFPAMGTFNFIWYAFIKGIRWTPFLDLMDYNKFDALNELKQKHNYKPYPYKHYESIFTRFYQGYLLPKKFEVDKRKHHLSTLIMAGQMSREEALTDISHIPYPSVSDQNNDIKYFLKKMGWSEEVLKNYLITPKIEHDAYPSEKHLWNKLSSIKNRKM